VSAELGVPIVLEAQVLTADLPVLELQSNPPCWHRWPRPPSARQAPAAESGVGLPGGRVWPLSPQRPSWWRRQRVGASTWKSPSADPSLTARLCAEGPGSS